MKKILKIFFSINLISTLIIFTWIANKIIIPNIQDTEISLIDCITCNIDKETYNTLNKKMCYQASIYGTKIGIRIVEVLDQFFPKYNYLEADYTVSYTYGNDKLNKIIETNNNIAQEGSRTALDLLKDNEGNIKRIKEQSLK